MASITPEIDAFQLAQTHGLRQGLGQMQQLEMLQRIGAVQAATQQREAALLRDRQLRGALSQLPPDATDEQISRTVMQYAGDAKDVLGHLDRRATIANTREMALARLQQAATTANRNATTAEQRAAVDAWYKRNQMAILAGRAAYELPPDLMPSITPQPAAVQPQGQEPVGGGTLQGDFGGVKVNLQGVTPGNMANLMADPETQANPTLLEALRGAGTATGSAPRPAPTQAPVAAPVVPPEAPRQPAVSPPTNKPIGYDQWPQKKKDEFNAAQAKGGTAGTAPGDFTKNGEAYLASLPEADRQLVKKIANYEVDPKTLETRGGQRSRMLSMVSQYDPTYDDTQYANRRRAIAQFGSGTLGNTVRSLNVAIEHTDTLQRAADALKNGDFTPSNTVYNEVAKIFGQTPPNTFEGMRNLVANEVLKGTIGTAGALEDRKELADKIKASSSPAQFQELITGWTELMGGQVKGLAKQYEGATGLKDFRERYLTDRTRQAIALAESKATSKSGGVPEFATEADAVKSGVKGKVKIGGRNAVIQ